MFKKGMSIMKIKVTVASVALLGAICFCAYATSQDNQDKLEGSKAYIPSRLEWLAVDLNASLRVSFSNENKYYMGFAHGQDDSIIIYIRYMPDVNRELMNKTIDSTKEIIKMRLESHKWTSIKIKEDVAALK